MLITKNSISIIRKTDCRDVALSIGWVSRPFQGLMQDGNSIMLR
jgi:hypothetical protein